MCSQQLVIVAAHSVLGLHVFWLHGRGGVAITVQRALSLLHVSGAATAETASFAAQAVTLGIGESGERGAEGRGAASERVGASRSVSVSSYSLSPSCSTLLLVSIGTVS